MYYIHRSLTTATPGGRRQQPGRRAGAGQRQGISGGHPVQRGRAGGPFGQRQGATGRGPRIAEGAAGSEEGSRRVRGQGPADEPREHGRILLVLVAEMVAVHGLRPATGGVQRGPTGYPADQQQAELYAVNGC